MKILLTASAKRDIAQLGDEEQVRVLSSLRDGLPGAVGTDAELKIPDLGAEVRVHRLADDGHVALYTTNDAGPEPTATVLTVLSQQDLANTQQLFGEGIQAEPATQNARIGSELLNQLPAG